MFEKYLMFNLAYQKPALFLAAPMAVLSSSYSVFIAYLGCITLSLPLIVQMIVWMLQNKFFTAKCGLGIILFQDIKVTKLHPGLAICHEIFQIFDEF